MKKTALLLASAFLSLIPVACGQKQVQETGYTPAFLDTVCEQGVFSEPLEPLDTDTAFELYHLAEYGFVREDFSACAALRSSGATCEEGAVLVLAQREGKTRELKQAMKDYLQRQIRDNESYRPAEIPKLQDAILDVQGDSLLLLVCADMDAARTALESRT